MERRLGIRYPADWSASYRFSNSGEWRLCRVVNMGERGIAIEPDSPIHGDLRAREVEIKFELSAHSDQFEVHGDVRHVTAMSPGHQLLGIVFKDLTELDEMILVELCRGLEIARLAQMPRHTSSSAPGQAKTPL